MRDTGEVHREHEQRTLGCDVTPLLWITLQISRTLLSVLLRASFQQVMGPGFVSSLPRHPLYCFCWWVEENQCYSSILGWDEALHSDCCTCSYWLIVIANFIVPFPLYLDHSLTQSSQIMWTLSEYSGTDTYAWDENLFVLPDLVIAMNFSKYDKAVCKGKRVSFLKTNDS